MRDAHHRLASRLSDAAKALPTKDRTEFRAFLRQQLDGVKVDTASLKHSWRKAPKTTARATRPRRRAQKEMFE